MFVCVFDQRRDPDAPIMLCRERVSAAVAAAPDKDAGKKAEADERVKVFEEICRDHVGADILTRYVHATVRVRGVDYTSKL